jgi:hypothetical protein
MTMLHGLLRAVVSGMAFMIVVKKVSLGMNPSHFGFED